MLAHYYAATFAVLLGTAPAVLELDERTFRPATAVAVARGAARSVPESLRIIRVSAVRLRDLLRVR